MQLHFYSFDLDDNLLHLDTKIHLDRIDESGNWIPVSVSTTEFVHCRNDSNYRVRENSFFKAYSEFRDNGDRKDLALLEDVTTGLKMGKFAPSWNKFKECLQSASLFSIITARGHEPSTFKKVIEMIIDFALTPSEQANLYNNALMWTYLFRSNKEYDRIPKGMSSQTPLIQNYLNKCDYYGVNSDSFAKEFGTIKSIEDAKVIALDKFINKCNRLGRELNSKCVSIGFSDDDSKNIKHIETYFHEKINDYFSHELKLSLYDTKNSEILMKKIIKISETTSQTTGLENSVISFTEFGNMTNRLYPSGDNPKDDYANEFKRKVKYLTKNKVKIKKLVK